MIGPAPVRLAEVMALPLAKPWLWERALPLPVS